MPNWQPAAEIPGLLTPPPIVNMAAVQEPITAVQRVSVNPTENTQAVRKAGAWRRYFARIIDLYISFFLVGILAYLALEPLNPALVEFLFDPKTSVALTNVLFLPFVLALDALIYGGFGNTLGKAVLAVKVLTVHGERPTAKQYARRNLGVWWGGLGIGFPLVSLVTLLYQANRVGGDRLPASYDEGKFEVLAGKLDWWRVIVAVAIFLMLLIIIVLSAEQ